MTKFSSFLVYTFGIGLIGFLVFTIVRTNFFPPPPLPPEERTIVPESSMAALEVGSRDQFLGQLDQLYASGGLDAVHDYVQKEWVPGRVVRGTIFSALDVTAVRIIDREVRRCDNQGSAMPNKAPILARAAPELHIGREARLETWTRLKEMQSFYLTVWFVPE